MAFYKEARGEAFFSGVLSLVTGFLFISLNDGKLALGSLGGERGQEGVAF